MTIIDKLERADGPDRELNAEIAKAVGMCLHPNRTRNGAQSDTGFDCDDCGADSWGNRSNDGFNRRLSDPFPAYTASIDTAMTLVSCSRAILNIAEDGITTAIVGGNEGCASTPALALCIASLRARSQGGE